MSRDRPPAKTDRTKAGRARRAILWTLLGLFIALLATVGGFYAWYVSEVRASNARVDPEVIAALNDPVATSTPPEVSAPDSVNIVILGSDTRSVNGKGGRSDTIILVHVDTENDFLSVLSIPRDLRVKIPGHGYNKINAAYAYGGAALLIRTIQSVMGVDLDHYAETDFTGFKAITDSLGGVYVDVDREYDDGQIRLQPGYQLLNGQDALRFCRTRHDKNIDFGRMQRQQRFMSAVREQAMGWSLAFKMPSLVDTVFTDVDTDLSANQIIRLAWWAVGLDGGSIKMASIVTSTGTIDGISFVLASDDQIASAVSDFLTPPTDTADEAAVEPAQATLAAAQALLPGGAGHPLPEVSTWSDLADEAGFAMVAPTYLPPECAYSFKRSYSIQVGGGSQPAVRVGYRLSNKDQYLGIGETTWVDAPLASPGTEVVQGDTVFTIVGTSTKTDHVWWVEDGVLCWVSNTLMYELSREQLLAVALSTVPVAGPR